MNAMRGHACSKLSFEIQAEVKSTLQPPAFRPQLEGKTDALSGVYLWLGGLTGAKIKRL
jgi:hypothetical protein